MYTVAQNILVKYEVVYQRVSVWVKGIILFGIIQFQGK